MSRFDRDDIEDDELRAEARAERRSMFHWCDICHGHTGPGSPCAPEPPEPPEEVAEDEEN